MRNWKVLSLSVSFTALLLAACATSSQGPQDSQVPVSPAWTRLSEAQQALAMGANAQVEQIGRAHV